MQQLDEMDIEGIMPLYEQLLAAVTSSQDQASPSTGQQQGSGSPASLDASASAEARAALRNYLTAATAKDCGIMVALQRVQATATSSIAGTAEGGDEASSAPGMPRNMSEVEGWEACAKVVRAGLPSPKILRVASGALAGTHFMFKVSLLTATYLATVTLTAG